jgi:hypothetical protein
LSYSNKSIRLSINFIISYDLIKLLLLNKIADIILICSLKSNLIFFISIVGINLPNKFNIFSGLKNYSYIFIKSTILDTFLIKSCGINFFSSIFYIKNSMAFFVSVPNVIKL